MQGEPKENKPKQDEGRAQTAIEYIMLVGMVIFFVIIVYMTVRSNVFGPVEDILNRTTGPIFDTLGNIGK